MSRFERALEEWLTATRLEREAVETGSLSKSIIVRRDAATVELHLAEDPWHACKCQTCSGRN